ncbi:CaiB/BaiF CoA transferase family protein [Phaeacidiphilus oryzae]|uniref:CaiB/BaiF CoA transferase family protein n=1 Tax=Phaeacidiphilus oryzae TaxID=348818 RepID=UPI0007C83852|nr:CoA transferase [Phaeacidiphilus oryzae]
MRIGETANDRAAAWGKPLDGVRVLALEQMQALPYATQLLARLGADVVKVEPPRTGESGRGSLPAMLDPEGRKVGITFTRNNFGKRSIGVDLKRPEGRDLVLRLAPRFDVVAENFKPGTADRLGLGYADIAAVHPRGVYLSVSGFGNGDSPYRGWPAYAPIAEAMAGLYDFKRDPETPPVVSPLGALGDTGAALFAVIGVLAALRHRERTGEGQHVDIAMYDAMVAFGDAGLNYWSMGLERPGNAPGINHSFRCADGFFILQCGRPHMFERLARTVGRPDWTADPRLAGPQDWFDRLEELIRPGIEEWARELTGRQATAALAAAGVAAGPVQSPAAVAADEHVRRRAMLVEYDRPDGVDRPILSPGNPVKLSRMTEGPLRRMPWLGEHTATVLREELDLDEAELHRLAESLTIGGPGVAADRPGVADDRPGIPDGPGSRLS